ncbi:DUF6089 family protein [Zunongwangia sp.]|uniref:type IX secretion system protein PorG n=1 Tax=Zunongwangia sp. TaxID=1965325 RepID=UPI003AA892D2
MRYLIAFISMLITCANLHSQTYEVGPFIGGANYIGDVGKTNYINPNSLVAGGVFKWNRSTRHAFRFSLLVGKIKANDLDSDDNRRKERGYSFSNTIAEASLGLEFNFWDFDLNKQSPQNTPYLYTGVTYFMADHISLGNTRTGPLQKANEKNWNFAIPLVIGWKTSLSKHLIGGLEIGARYTFTDNLDGSNPEEFTGKLDSVTTFGNSGRNDWYVFTGLTFTVTFGRKPCYFRF